MIPTDDIAAQRLADLTRLLAAGWQAMRASSAPGDYGRARYLAALDLTPVEVPARCCGSAADLDGWAASARRCRADDLRDRGYEAWVAEIADDWLSTAGDGWRVEPDLDALPPVPAATAADTPGPLMALYGGATAARARLWYTSLAAALDTPDGQADLIRAGLARRLMERAR